MTLDAAFRYPFTGTDPYQHTHSVTHKNCIRPAIPNWGFTAAFISSTISTYLCAIRSAEITMSSCCRPISHFYSDWRFVRVPPSPKHQHRHCQRNHQYARQSPRSIKCSQNVLDLASSKAHHFCTLLGDLKRDQDVHKAWIELTQKIRRQDSVQHQACTCGHCVGHRH